jgi:hypothetical protein
MPRLLHRYVRRHRRFARIHHRLNQHRARRRQRLVKQRAA